MERESIKFSILVPVYQVEKYIDECIQSVLAQTYSDWELILVDDGTKDRSGVICDRYAEKDSRIHVYHKENQGLIHTRRYGIARATGDYYIFLDSDDTLKPHALQTIYDTIQKYRCDCVIYGYHRLWSGKLTKGSEDEMEKYMEDKREVYRKCFMGKYNTLWRKATKASVFRGGAKDYSAYYHLQVAEDLLQSIEILEGSKSVAFIEDKLYNYRFNPNSVMQSITFSEKHQVDLSIMQAVLDFWETQDVFTAEDVAEYRGYCLWLISKDVYRVCASDTSYRNKKRILRQIKETEYYHNVMDKEYTTGRLGLDGKVISRLFLKEHYGVLCFICPIYKCLRKMMKKPS